MRPDADSGKGCRTDPAIFKLHPVGLDIDGDGRGRWVWADIAVLKPQTLGRNEDALVEGAKFASDRSSRRSGVDRVLKWCPRPGRDEHRRCLASSWKREKEYRGHYGKSRHCKAPPVGWDGG